MTPRDRSDAPDARVVAVWAIAAVALLVLLGLWQQNGYWEYSDGVYALTSRLLLDGGDLYGGIAAAQPPPLYLAGAAVLAISDTPTAVRVAMAALELATSALVLVAVRRLTRSDAAAVVAALAVLVTPWMLREHAQLIPETFAAPLLLGAALATGSSAGAGPHGRRAALLAGLLAALATAFKLAFALPAIIVLLAAGSRASRLRGLASFAVTGAVLALAALLAYGDPLLDGAVRAQREAGLAGLGYVGGLWAQAGWNLLPLLACAALAWPFRARIGDPVLVRSLAAAAAGSLLLLASLFKSGSYLTVLVVIEPPLLCLAAAGVVAAWRARGAVRWALPLAAVAILLGAVQVGSLLVDPGDPRPFTRPFAQSGPGRSLSPEEVDRAVAAIRACPAQQPTSGPPYLAFVAGRRIAGDQPDQFIIERAPVLGPLRTRADADAPRCP